MSAPPTTDLGAEREIDLSWWRSALVERWWILAAGLVVGALVGAVWSVSGGSVYVASVLIAPGQPFSPSGSPVLTYQSSPRAIQQIATGQISLLAAAAKAGMPVGELHGNVSTTSVSTGLGTSTTNRGAQLIEVTVKGSKPKKVAAAANALANIIVADTTSKYVTDSIAIFEQRQGQFTRRLKSVDNVIASFNKALATQNLDPLNRLVLVNDLDAYISTQGNLQNELSGNEQQLTLAQSIEVAQIIRKAAAEKTIARSRRTSIAFGALIGVLIGAIVAIVVGSRARRARTA